MKLKVSKVEREGVVGLKLKYNDRCSSYHTTTGPPPLPIYQLATHLKKI